MREPTLTYDRPERGFRQVHNDEASLDIGAGQPCCFNFDGTDNGLAVVLPVTGTVAKHTTGLAGIANNAIAAGEKGTVQVYGPHDAVKLIKITRATSTDPYVSKPAIAIGDILQIQPLGNGVERNGAGAVAKFMAYAVAMEVVASNASSASTTSDTSTEVTTTIKAFLRIAP
jgi:hypothetical protein